MFFGPLADFVGQKEVVFDLPDGATYGHLLDDIDRRFGQKFHERIWDAEANVFRKGILVVGTGRDHDDRETPLLEDEEIKVVPFLPGG